MNTLLQRIAFTFTQASKKFQIVKGRYLVPVKPKRVQSGFLLFAQQQRPKIQAASVAQSGKKIGQLWRSLSQQQKKQYNEQSQKLNQQHQVEREQYQLKYVQPFKSLNLRNLALKKLYQSNDVKFQGVGQVANQLNQYLSKLSAQQKAVLQKQLTDLKAQRQQIQKQFAIPELQYKTLRSFMMSQVKDKKISELTESQRQTLSNRYAKYLEKHQRNLSDFAAKFGMSFSDLVDVIKRHQRRLDREKPADLEQIASKPAAKKPSAKKPAAKKAVAKKPAAKKTATGAKKTATGAKRVVKRGTTTKKATTKKQATK